MPGPFVSIGCNVMLTPGAAGAPDMGVITVIPQATLTVGGMPVAVRRSVGSTSGRADGGGTIVAARTTSPTEQVCPARARMSP